MRPIVVVIGDERGKQAGRSGVNGAPGPPIAVGSADTKSCDFKADGVLAWARPFHERMPVVIEAAGWDRWLDRSVTDPEAIADLLRPATEDFFVAMPVSRRMNNPRANDPACVEPVGEAVPPSP